MLRTRWLLAAFPFLVLPTLLVMLLTSCSRKDSPPRPSASTSAVSRFAPVMPACGSSGCMPLDEFDPLQDAGAWLTLNCDGAPCCTGVTGDCDITAQLQAQVATIASNSNHGAQPSVLYIPAAPSGANYTINQPIIVQNAYGGAIVGDDPTTTIISWAGPSVGSFDAGADAGPAAPGEAMIVLQDSTNTKIARLTLDGRAGGPVTFDGGWQQWLAGLWVVQTPSYATTGGHATYSLDIDDDVFKNLSFGLITYNYTTEVDDPPDGGGSLSTGSAPYTIVTPFEFNYPAGEVQSNVGNSDVRRSSFENISVQGVVLSGDNTLVWLLEDNAFLGCHRGVVLNEGTSATLVNNYFFNDPGSTDDSVNIIATTSGSGNVIRGNVSYGSMMFYTGNLNWTEMSGNYVSMNPASAHCFPIHESGSLMLLDNYISVPAEGTCTQETVVGCGLTTSTFGGAKVESGSAITHGGNAFTGPSSALVQYQNEGWGSFREVCVGGDAGCPSGGDSADTFGSGVSPPTAAYNAWVGWGSPDSMTTFASANRPTFAPKVTGRTVVNVATTFPSCLAAMDGNCPMPSAACAGDASTAGTLDKWLSTAATAGGQYLLYFPTGHYCIEKPISVPQNLDVVIAGDGPTSQLYWTGNATDAAVFEAQAPSIAMFRDFSMIAIYPGSRPIGILVDSSASETQGLVYIDNTNVAGARNGLEIAGVDGVLVRAEQFGPGSERGVTVIGGGAASASSASTLGLFMLSGGNGQLSDYVTLRNWGKAIFVGTDNEGFNQGMALDQSGYLTLSTGRFLPYLVQPAYRGLYEEQPNVVAQSTFQGRLTYANLVGAAGVFSIAASQAQVLAINDNIASPGTNEGPGGATTPTCSACPTYGYPCGTPPATIPFPAVSQGSTGAIQMALSNNGPCLCPVTLARTSTYYNDTNGNPAAPAPNVFAATMLDDLRKAPYGAPVCPTSCGSGQTQVRIHGVAMFGGDSTLGGMAPASWLRAGIRVQRVN